MANSNRPVCAVVGVGPGLGAALARRFGKEYAVALIARGEDKLVALAKEIEGAGGKALAVPADVSKAADITAAFDKVRRVAKTIADLEGSATIQEQHIAEAVQYRLLDRRF